jgi:hypothetical protein
MNCVFHPRARSGSSAGSGPGRCPRAVPFALPSCCLRPFPWVLDIPWHVLHGRAIVAMQNLIGASVGGSAALSKDLEIGCFVANHLEIQALP